MKNFIILISLMFFTAYFISCEDDPFEKDSGTFVDSRDNHKYRWVRIGKQIWMAENLAYNPHVCSPADSCGTYIYDYEGSGPYGENYIAYGCLYTWEKAQEACPQGWHIPTDEEWKELEQFLGMKLNEINDLGFRGELENVGGKLKDAKVGWESPNIGATNEVNLNARGGGYFTTRFTGKNEFTRYWSSTQELEEYMITRDLFNYSPAIQRGLSEKTDALSIRCIKN